MPHKLFRIQRAERSGQAPPRPVMLAIAGESAAGKTTITRGRRRDPQDAMRITAAERRPVVRCGRRLRDPGF